MKNDEKNIRIAKNTLLLSIRMVLVLCLGLYTTRVTLKALGIDDFGIYNVVCGFVSMFVFLNTSMSNGIQRYFNYEIGKNGIEGARRVFVTSLIVQTLLLFLIIFFTETVGVWYLHNKMVIPPERFCAAQWIFQTSVISFMLIIIQVPFNAVIMAYEHMDFYAFIGILDAILKLFVVILIPFLNADRLILYGLLLLFINLLNLILAIVYVRSHFVEIRIQRIFDKSLFKSMLSFSGWNIFGSFSSMMREQGLNVILNLFFGPVVNAARGIAYQISSGLQGFVTNLSTSVRPQIVQSYSQGNYERTISLMLSLSKVSISLLYIIGYPILLEINYVLNLWLSDDVPDYTASFVIIVILITFINNLNAAVSAVVHATGKMSRYQVITSTITLISLPVAYYALSVGGDPNSVFWISFVFTLMMQIISLFILRELVSFSLSQYFKKVLLPFISVLVCSFTIPLVPFYSMKEGFARFMVVTIVAVSFSSIIFYLIGLSKGEKLLFNSLFVKLIHFIKR